MGATIAPSQGSYDAATRAGGYSAGSSVLALMLLLAVPVTAWGMDREPTRWGFWLFVPALIASVAAVVPTWYVSLRVNPHLVPKWAVVLFFLLFPVLGVACYLCYFLPVFGAWFFLGLSAGLDLPVFREYVGLWWLFLVGTAALMIATGSQRLVRRVVSWALPGVDEKDGSPVLSYLALMMPWLVPPAFAFRGTRAWAKQHWRQALGNLAVIVGIAAWAGGIENLAVEILLSPAVIAMAMISIALLLTVHLYIMNSSASFWVRAVWLLALVEYPIALIPFHEEVQARQAVSVAVQEAAQRRDAGHVEEARELLEDALDQSVKHGFADNAADIAWRLANDLITAQQYEQANRVIVGALSVQDLDALFSAPPAMRTSAQEREALAQRRVRIIELMILRMQSLLSLGRFQEAIHASMETIRRASEAGLWNHDALARELAAKIYRQVGQTVDAVASLAIGRMEIRNANGPPDAIQRLEQALQALEQSLGDPAYRDAVTDCAKRHPEACSGLVR